MTITDERTVERRNGRTYQLAKLTKTDYRRACPFTGQHLITDRSLGPKKDQRSYYNSLFLQNDADANNHIAVQKNLG